MGRIAYDRYTVTVLHFQNSRTRVLLTFIIGSITLTGVIFMIFFLLFLVLGLIVPVILGSIAMWLFPSIAPLATTAAEPAGFFWGLAHGLLAPATVFQYLIGRDVEILAQYRTETSYIVGFIIGVLTIISPKKGKK